MEVQTVVMASGCINNCFMATAEVNLRQLSLGVKNWSILLEQSFTVNITQMPYGDSN